MPFIFAQANSCFYVWMVCDEGVVLQTPSGRLSSEPNLSREYDKVLSGPGSYSFLSILLFIPHFTQVPAANSAASCNLIEFLICFPSVICKCKTIYIRIFHCIDKLYLSPFL